MTRRSLLPLAIALLALASRPACAQWAPNGNDIYNTNSGNVGIGTAYPGAALTVATNKFVLGGLGLLGSYGSNDVVFESQASGNSIWQHWAGVNGGGAAGITLISSPSNNYAGIVVNKLGNGPVLPFLFFTNGVERLRIATNGYVGIGTSTPSASLDVQGDGIVTGNLTVTGNIAAKYQDVAEWVPVREFLASGTVVVLDASISNTVARSAKAYDVRVAGVVSEMPGLLLGEPGADRAKVATSGRVKVKVDAQRRPIHIGDLLVTSDCEGMAMTSEPFDVAGVSIHRPGTIVGKALEPLSGGHGEILVLLSLQ
ncbi:MAG: hypothetical protein ABIQ65_20065 [Thermoanaerobaculia bacterium]